MRKQMRSQANRFIDFVVDQSALLQSSRVVRMRTPQMEIDKLSIGTRIMAKATEASDTGANAAVTFTKVSLTTVKLRLDWEISTESLEDNIAGDSLEDHLASVMARQTANDLDDFLLCPFDFAQLHRSTDLQIILQQFCRTLGHVHEDLFLGVIFRAF